MQRPRPRQFRLLVYVDTAMTWELRSIRALWLAALVALVSGVIGLSRQRRQSVRCRLNPHRPLQGLRPE
jgi:hypothetical protein